MPNNIETIKRKAKRRKLRPRKVTPPTRLKSGIVSKGEYRNRNKHCGRRIAGKTNVLRQLVALSIVRPS